MLRCCVSVQHASKINSLAEGARRVAHHRRAHVPTVQAILVERCFRLVAAHHQHHRASTYSTTKVNPSTYM